MARVALAVGPTSLVLVTIKSLEVNLSISPCSWTSMPSDLYAMISLMFEHEVQDTLAQKFAFLSIAIAHLQDHVDASGGSARHSGARSSVTSDIDLLMRSIHRRPCSASDVHQPCRPQVCDRTLRYHAPSCHHPWICGRRVSMRCTARCPGGVLFGHMFFSLELS